jgi:hypothetical protein
MSMSAEEIRKDLNRKKLNIRFLWRTGLVTLFVSNLLEFIEEYYKIINNRYDLRAFSVINRVFTLLTEVPINIG